MQSLWRWVSQNQRMLWCQKVTSLRNHVLSRGGLQIPPSQETEFPLLYTQVSQASTATFPQDALGDGVTKVRLESMDSD